MREVSVVIPCYNAAGFIAEAIESVRTQSRAVEELIVVDDGSTDGSGAIARTLGATVLETGGRHGQAAARNLGVRQARAPYIAFLDADDVWLPRHCELLLQVLEGSPRVAVSFGRIQRFDAQGDFPFDRRSDLEHEGSLPALLLDNPIPQSAAIVRRTMFQEVGGYRDGFQPTEDYDLWLRLAERFEITGVDHITCRYRVHPAQLTHVLMPVIRGSWKARLSARERLTAQGKYDDAAKAMLLRALQEDIHRAWTGADPEALRELLQAAVQLRATPGIVRGVRVRLALVALPRLLLSIRKPRSFK